MTTWHADPTVLARYRNGELPDSMAFSVEAHLPSCADCRQALSALMVDAGIETVWDDIVAELDAPRPGFAERFLSALGLPDHMARLVMATPFLQLSTSIAVALAAMFAVIASRNTGDNGQHFFFLVSAPLVPVLAIAAAFSASSPTSDVERTTALSGLSLVMARAIPVLAVSLLSVSVAAQIGPPAWSGDVRWILPSLALSIGTVTLSAFAPIGIVSAALTGIWLVGAAASAQWRPFRFGVDTDAFVAFQPVGQLIALGLAMACCVVLIRRSHLFDMRGI